MAASVISAVVFAASMACVMGFAPTPMLQTISSKHAVLGSKTGPMHTCMARTSRRRALLPFAMQAKGSPILSSIDKVVKENKIIVFMKGTKDFPQCGFSNTVVQVCATLPGKLNTRFEKN